MSTQTDVKIRGIVMQKEAPVSKVTHGSYSNEQTYVTVDGLDLEIHYTLDNIIH